MKTPAMTIAEVKFAACRYFGTTQQALTGRDRRKDPAMHRNVAMTVSRAVTKASTTDVGRAFGGRDHTTVISAVRHVARDADMTRHAIAVMALVEDREWMRMTVFRDWVRDCPFRTVRA